MTTAVKKFKSVLRFVRGSLLFVIGGWMVFYFGLYLGCGVYQTWGHEEFAKNGLAQIQPAEQMDRLYDNCRRYITYGGPSTSIWNSVAYFGGRYELTMQVSVEIESATSGHMTGEPKFRLLEVTDVESSPSGQVGASFGRNFNFGLVEWQKVFAADGDYSVIGFEINRDPPVPDFEAFAKSSRPTAP